MFEVASILAAVNSVEFMGYQGELETVSEAQVAREKSYKSSSSQEGVDSNCPGCDRKWKWGSTAGAVPAHRGLNGQHYHCQL